MSTCDLICSEDKVVIEELYFIAAVRLTKKSEILEKFNIKLPMIRSA